ncbi:MAG: hypothetical protein MAG551_00369 [Candidatus Scalindua arabica]|uniref:Magnesium transporter MgtE intracellular domain-containing protein n=1 Tax=Candidatus Scalindua arabica TaxID=1127984 RepID=A0A942A3V7_9BACT|nr:hypothetical protein [Candidatus Scalindua arabica]
MKNLQVVGQDSDESLKEKNIRKLALIYQKMDTEKAVSILSRLDNDTAVRILSRMNKKQLAKILELVETNEATRLTGEIRDLLKMESQKENEKLEGA